MKKHILSVAVASALASTSAFATNGMMLEGYGSRSTALGGAGYAFDTGNSGAFNNPATLVMRKEGSNVGVGIRMLGPDITSSFGPFISDSDGTAYWMPSASYIRKSGDMAYGVAMLAQGGMGTEYGAGSALFAGGMAQPFNGAGVPLPPVPTFLSGQEIRSEVGVGGLMFPISKQITDRFNIGGSIDFVWASMDLQMDMDGTQFTNLMLGNGGSLGGSMAAGLGPFLPGNTLNWGRFDFSDDNAMTGEASATGWAGKLGFTFAVSDRLTIGGSYRTETSLGDLEADNATLSMNLAAPGTIAMQGDLRVVDFQWPESYGIGLAFQATDKLLLVGDVKHIGWSDVMDSFKMSFTPHAGQPFAGTTLEVAMDQKWDDQTVFSLGAEYQATPQVALRVGMNLSDNPVPDTFVNPLFPAIIENHFTAGFGYKIDDSSKLDMSFTYAPDVDVTGTGPLNNGLDISHGQFNWSLSYAKSF